MNNALRAPACEVVSFGTELLSGNRLNSHLVYLGRRLEALGFLLDRAHTVCDRTAVMAKVLAGAVERSGLVLITGGLGPTTDDITREALARAADLPLELSRREYKKLLIRLKSRLRTAGLGRKSPDLEGVRWQSMAPRGARFLPNRVGTAPGLWLRYRGAILAALPGPTEEMTDMFESCLVPRLKRSFPGRPVSQSDIIRTCGMSEGEVQRRIQKHFSLTGPLRVSVTAHVWGVDLSLRALAPTRAKARLMLSQRKKSLLDLLGQAPFGGPEDSLESACLSALRRRGWTLALAESCTGGLVSGALTRVPGSSRSFDGGVVAYSNHAKESCLAVPASLLSRHGAVSGPCARAMAQGARQRFGSSVGLSVTGIAGPGGGSPSKPVGLVFLGLALPGRRPLVKKRIFKGDRGDIRQRATVAALDWMRREVGLG